MDMNTVSFRASEPLEAHIPDEAEVVTVRYAGDTETVEYRVSDDEYACEECGESFDNHQGLAGHMNKH